MADNAIVHFSVLSSLLLRQSASGIHKSVNAFLSLRIYWNCGLIRLRIFLTVRSLYLARSMHFSGISAVYLRNEVIRSSAEVIGDPFQVFLCLVQKINILWKGMLCGAQVVPRISIPLLPLASVSGACGSLQEVTA